MVQLSELTRDKSFRTRLILACLGVSLFVSVIYVVVSYRLTAELGVETGLQAMEKEANIILSELVSNNDGLAASAASVATMIYGGNEEEAGIFARVSRDEGIWVYVRGLKASQADDFRQYLADHTDLARGMLEFGDEKFLYIHAERNGYKLDLIQTTTSLDLTMAMVAKRLSIVSVIVLWIAIWLALTLSSFIAKRVQQKNDALAKIATHDGLTGFPNRRFLDDLLETCIDNASSSPDSKDEPVAGQGCLFVIDLDKFKEVNDSFGHAAGDKLLVEIALRLHGTLSSNQVLVRVGGDEFIIWAPGLNIDEAKGLAKSLVEQCDAPVMINNLAINTGASIGIAHYPTHADSGESLIINADTAMYKAKQLRCGWMLFDESNAVDYKKQLRLRAELTGALEREEIKLYYQPKVSLKDGDIIGVEALARWHHPIDGILPPGAFIDLIEHSGRVQEFGRYIICQSIKQLAAWRSQQIKLPLALNLSPYNLLDPGLVDFIAGTLEQFDVPASLLEIELTESETSMNIESIQSRLDALKVLGVTLTIDDFGTGMSSLAYIANLNVNIIKIDRAFICDMLTNDKHLAIVSTALALSKSFGCKMVAEGIEDKAQAEKLLAMGCDYGQGYLFSKPVESNAITALYLKGGSLL